MRMREPGVDDPPKIQAEDPEEVAERERLRAIIHRPLSQRPLSQRPRVNYQRSFLDHYKPNVDFYLPGKLREELHLLGQSDNMARLPAGTYIHSVFNRVLIDLAWNSSRLEGNTFSLLETDRLLALGRSGDPTRVIEARMILNHKEAIEYLVDASSEIGFNRYTILNLHAILAVYELNRVELLRDVFARAYRSSAGRYSEARRAMKMPDILGLTYHGAVRGAARSVVQGRMDKANAAEHIRRWSLDQVPVADRARVVELVEAGLLSLHDGNFAKYRVSPLEFAAWHAVWTRQP